MSQTITIEAGQTLTITTPVQVDSTGTPLPAPDPTYGSATIAFDSTFFTQEGAPISGEFLLKSTGLAGTTEVTTSETSSDTTKPVITDVITVTVTEPAAAGLESTLSAA